MNPSFASTPVPISRRASLSCRFGKPDAFRLLSQTSDPLGVHLYSIRSICLTMKHSNKSSVVEHACGMIASFSFTSTRQIYSWRVSHSTCEFKLLSIRLQLRTILQQVPRSMLSYCSCPFHSGYWHCCSPCRLPHAHTFHRHLHCHSVEAADSSRHQETALSHWRHHR